MEQTRREFLRTCAYGCALGALSYFGVGCSDSGSGNPSSSSPQTITLNLADYPPLADDNSSVSVSGTALGRPLLITHTTGDTYYALDSRCTHQSCTVVASTPTLNCPCHGSRFSLTGSVSSGPASTPLRSFTIRKDGNTLKIDIP